MNSIVFGGDKGKRAEVYYLFGRYFCHGILFTRSHIIQLRWSILFIFCVLASEGMNSIVFGERKRKNQKTTTCSEDLSSRRLFSLTSGKRKGLSSVKLEKRFSIVERVNSRLLSPPPFPSQRLLNSFLLEPKHRKKKSYHIPYAASERD